MDKTISETDFAELKLLKRGKVRDVYDLGEHLLMVATDRISAFDVVMPRGIPYKGQILNQIATKMMHDTKDLVPRGALIGKRVVRGREPECLAFYAA